MKQIYPCTNKQCHHFASGTILFSPTTGKNICGNLYSPCLYCIHHTPIKLDLLITKEEIQENWIKLGIS
jgi:hypothetical protein